MCTLEFFPVHWINCTNQSGFYCLKLETCVYNKSNKSGDLHLKIAQPTKKQETGDKMCSWGHDCLESLCQGQDPVKGQQLFSLSEQR